MSERYELRFAGSGGQGVILASVILAEAAVISGLNTVQSQAYGPEARGGVSKAETIVSRETIWFSKVKNPDFLLALTQASVNAYAPSLKEDGVMMIDDSLQAPEGFPKEKLIRIPVLATAAEKVGKAFTANIVAVGAINAALGLFGEAELLEAVKRHIPRGTEVINQRALDAGKALIQADQAEAFRRRLG